MLSVDGGSKLPMTVLSGQAFTKKHFLQPDTRAMGHSVMICFLGWTDVRSGARMACRGWACWVERYRVLPWRPIRRHRVRQ